MCIRSGARRSIRDSSTVEGANQIVDEWHAAGSGWDQDFGEAGIVAGYFSDDHGSAREEWNMGVAVHIGQDGVYPMNAVRVAADGASTIEHHYGYAESSFRIAQRSDFAAGLQLFERAGSIFGDGAVWLQADVAKLHGEVIDSLLDSMHKTGFIMVPTFGIYEANRDVDARDDFAVARDVHAAGGDGFVFAESGASRVVFL